MFDILTELHDAYPEYQWFPDMLINATHSAENLARQLSKHLENQKTTPQEEKSAFIRQELLERGLGVYDAIDEEVNRLLNESDPWPASYILADIISRRAQVGWTTHGHSGSFPLLPTPPISNPPTLHLPLPSFLLSSSLT